MNKLPDELMNNIFINLLDQEPNKLYILRGINHKFKNLIDNLNNNYNEKNYNENNIANTINHLLYKDKDWNIKIFNWLFKNGIRITFNNITNIIRNDRLDVLKSSFINSCNKDILYDSNRYNILSLGLNSRLVKENSPLIIAGKNNNKNIIDFLLSKDLNNPFLRQIDILVDTLVENNNKDLIKHMFDFYYENMIGKQLTSLKVLKNMDNCEDLILNWIKYGKICINNDLILTSIKKKYTDVCILAYNNISNLIIPNEHIEQILKTNNLILLTIFIKLYPRHFYIILDYIKYTMVTKEIFMYIFNNYLKWIDNDYPLLEIYLQYDSDINNIKYLLNNNYIVTKKTIIQSLEVKNKEVFRLLSKKY